MYSLLSGGSLNIRPSSGPCSLVSGIGPPKAVVPIKYGVPPNAAAAAVVAWKVGGPLFGPDELLAPLLICGHGASTCSYDPHIMQFIT